ncbi:MAG: hypothetical protein LBU32_14365 [Clostridiales bacterium]|nr:hypothetical protein [Clostridiales bacterium]
MNCSKTYDAYTACCKDGYFKAFQAAHESEILLHQASKKAFDELSYDKGKKIPSISSLCTKYDAALDEKKRACAK